MNSRNTPPLFTTHLNLIRDHTTLWWGGSHKFAYYFLFDGHFSSVQWILFWARANCVLISGRPQELLLLLLQTVYILLHKIKGKQIVRYATTPFFFGWPGVYTYISILTRKRKEGRSVYIYIQTIKEGGKKEKVFRLSWNVNKKKKRNWEGQVESMVWTSSLYSWNAFCKHTHTQTENCAAHASREEMEK